MTQNVTSLISLDHSLYLKPPCFSMPTASFAVCQELEPMLEGEKAGRALVYVPLAHEHTHNALVEAHKGGELINLSLSRIASDALLPFLGPKGAPGPRPETTNLPAFLYSLI